MIWIACNNCEEEEELKLRNESNASLMITCYYCGNSDKLFISSKGYILGNDFYIKGHMKKEELSHERQQNN